MAELINRPLYLSQLVQHRDVDLIKIVTGIRRCGKSSLLDLFHRYLTEQGVPESRIIHMNMESLRYRNLTGYQSFYDYVGQTIASRHEKTYLLFDEIQAVEHWEKAIQSFRLDYDADIYITGSNAYLLSAELLTLLSGRYVEIRMLPLSFREFLDFYEFAPGCTMDEKFQKYLQFGGMPAFTEYGFDEERSFQALEGIYSSIVLRDILQRHRGTDYALLQKTVLYLCSHIGSIASPNSIANALSGQGNILVGSGRTKNMAGKTVEKYISMLRNAFVFYSVPAMTYKASRSWERWAKTISLTWAFATCCLAFEMLTAGLFLKISSFWNSSAAGTACIQAGQKTGKLILWLRKPTTGSIYRLLRACRCRKQGSGNFVPCAW